MPGNFPRGLGASPPHTQNGGSPRQGKAAVWVLLSDRGRLRRLPLEPRHQERVESSADVTERTGVTGEAAKRPKRRGVVVTHRVSKIDALVRIVYVPADDELQPLISGGEVGRISEGRRVQVRSLRRGGEAAGADRPVLHHRLVVGHNLVRAELARQIEAKFCRLRRMLSSVAESLASLSGTTLMSQLFSRPTPALP